MFATPNILLQRVTVAAEKSGLMKPKKASKGRARGHGGSTQKNKNKNLPSISAHGLFLECALCMHMERKFHM
jgi:hypothetical protein